MVKVNLLIIGAQKCGTSSAVKVLNKHPDIFMYTDNRVSEVHFFDRHYKKGYDWYEKNFPLHKNFKYIGESTPKYMCSEQIMKRIYNYNNNMKLLIFLREPIQRAYSQWNMWCDGYSRNKNPKPPDLFTSIQTNKSDIISRGKYNEHLQYIFKIFPRKNIHIIISENLWNNYQSEYNSLFNFLDIENITVGNICSNSSITKNYINTLFNSYKRELRYMYDEYQSYNNELYKILNCKIEVWEIFYKNIQNIISSIHNYDNLDKITKKIKDEFQNFSLDFEYLIQIPQKNSYIENNNDIQNKKKIIQENSRKYMNNNFVKSYLKPQKISDNYSEKQKYIHSYIDEINELNKKNSITCAKCNKEFNSFSEYQNHYFLHNF